MIISKATKQLLIPYNDKIRALWPQAKTVGHNGHQLAVLPHNPRTQVQLHAAGIKAPAPILTQYDWAGSTPFATQKTTAAMLTSNQRAFVLSDMGTGKTRAALWAWDYLYKIGYAKKLLIVAPLSTLKFTWLSEITKILPYRKAVVLHGSREQRLKSFNQNFDIAIVNHDGFKVILQELHACKEIDTLILDELAVYRNNSDRSKTMRVFAPKMTWAWGLTGRPIPQSPTDAWGQCKILTPGNVPRYFRHARTMLMVQISPFKWIPKSDAVETAYSWMQPSIRYSLDDVVELPEMVSRMVDVDLTEQQARIYRKMANELAVMIENKQIVAANAAVGLGKLLQLACGVVYTDNPLYVALDAEPRRQMLLELIEEAPEKVIVFAPYRHLIEKTSELLTQNSVDHAVIHGGTGKREEILNDFQNSIRYRVLLAHPQTLHHGVTLTTASTVVWLSPPTSLEVYEQACARIRRFGQHHKQQYFHLQSTSVERKIYAGLRQKQRLQDEFLDMIRTATEDL